jgi:maltooligosyltrehalose trehalohydrolase
MLFMGEEWGASTPWQYFTDHTDPALAEAVRDGRRAEFAGHGWKTDDVPDPQAAETFHRSKLDWSEPTREPYARLLRWYQDLVALRRTRPALRDPHLDQVDASFDQANGAFWMRRGGHQVLANLSDADQEVDAVGQVLLSWEPGVSVEAGRVVVPARSAVIVGP